MMGGSDSTHLKELQSPCTCTSPQPDVSKYSFWSSQSTTSIQLHSYRAAVPLTHHELQLTPTYVDPHRLYFKPASALLRRETFRSSRSLATKHLKPIGMQCKSFEKRDRHFPRCPIDMKHDEPELSTKTNRSCVNQHETFVTILSVAHNRPSRAQAYTERTRTISETNHW